MIQANKTIKSIEHNKDIAQYAVWQAVGQTYAITKGIPDDWFLDAPVFTYVDSNGKKIHWSVVGQQVLSCMERGEDFADIYKFELEANA